MRTIVLLLVAVLPRPVAGWSQALPAAEPEPVGNLALQALAD